MTLFITFTALISTTLATLTILSPISLGAAVLTIALTTAMIISLLISGWFGLITFIIYIGGMLVIFAYFAALQPNQHITTWTTTLLPLIIFLSIASTSSINPLINIRTPTVITYILTNNYATLFIALSLLLFLALISVVKVSRSNEGPLRPFYV